MDNSNLTIENRRIRVKIDLPGTSYRESRFDWTGFIREVTLDGKHRFCGTEGGGSNGAGLCNEFGITTPVGFDETAPGELFPKLGVGLLRRPDNRPYCFSRPYEVEPYDMEMVKKNERSLTVITSARDCKGYAAALQKTITVEENSLTIRYHLDNTGSLALRTEEYAHNFLAIDGNPIGPDYQLEVDSPIEFKKLPEVLKVSDDRCLITWLTSPDEAFYCRCENPGAIRQWEISHRTARASMRETIDTDCSLFALWGTGRVVSPEIFVRIDLPPGKSMVWTRRYEFFNR